MAKTTTLYRETMMRRLAAERGFDFAARDDYGLSDQLKDFQLFKQGYRQELRYILRKQDDMLIRDARVFDFRYTPYGAKGANSVYQTVFFLQSQQLGLPDMHMKPESLLHKLGGIFGVRDINFVRFPKFSGQYYLKGGNEEYIRHHFTDEVLHYFTTAQGWSLEGVGYYLLLYKKGTILPTSELAKFYQQGLEIARLFTDEKAR